MKAALMCFSAFQIPTRRIYTFALESFDRSRIHEDIYSFRKLGTRVCGAGGQNKRWTRRTLTTSTGETNKVSTTSRKRVISPPVISKDIAVNTKFSDTTESSEVAITQKATDLKLQISNSKEMAGLVTFMVMDIETTGFSREEGRIIEIALQDLKGGFNSTFQTLVNPNCRVPNAHIHGITSSMVTKPGVPSMEELIPILLKYIRSRQKPGGHVVFVAHNGRTFDIPFLINEFARWSHEIPSNWLFLDTLPLAREAMKSAGLQSPSRVSLQALREFYRIPLAGSAHRAMSDVHSLALIFQKLTCELKLTTSHLVQRTFEKSDLVTAPKKKKKSAS